MAEGSFLCVFVPGKTRSAWDRPDRDDGRRLRASSRGGGDPRAGGWSPAAGSPARGSLVSGGGGGGGIQLKERLDQNRLRTQVLRLASDGALSIPASIHNLSNSHACRHPPACALPAGPAPVRPVRQWPVFTPLSDAGAPARLCRGAASWLPVHVGQGAPRGMVSACHRARRLHSCFRVCFRARLIQGLPGRQLGPGQMASHARRRQAAAGQQADGRTEHDAREERRRPPPAA